MSTTRTQFDEELERLHAMLLAMGAMADQALFQAMRALEHHDVAIAEAVLANDDDIDQMDIQIEIECLRMIALQQPNSRDLRLIGAAIKVVTDLERIGDHAVDIAKVARKLGSPVGERYLRDLSQMGDAVRGMLRSVLESLVHHDLSLADSVIDADDEVDDLFHAIRSGLQDAMQENPEFVFEGSYLLFVSYYLERIADHAVNIAERVYYVEIGDLMPLERRHSKFSKGRECFSESDLN